MRQFISFLSLGLQLFGCIANMLLITAFLMGYNTTYAFMKTPEGNQNTCYMSSPIYDNSVCLYQMMLSSIHLFIGLVICLALIVDVRHLVIRRLLVILIFLALLIVWSVSIPTFDKNIAQANHDNVPGKDTRTVVMIVDWLMIGLLVVSIGFEIWMAMDELCVLRQTDMRIDCNEDNGITVEITSLSPNPQRMDTRRGIWVV